MKMGHNIGVLVLLAILIIVPGISSNHRRYHSPPSSFGRNAEFDQNQYGQEQNFGSYGQYQPPPNYPSQIPNQMEYGGLQQQSPNDDYDGGIQQVSRDTEDFSSLLQQSQTEQNEIVDENPPKYTQATEDSSEQIRQNQQTSTAVPEAVTPKGTFIGKKETVNGKDVYAFYGVPYAKPPLGNLRFRRPEPADKREEPFEATTLPNTCTQIAVEVFPDFPGEQMWNPSTNISEDCLFLNIWVPASVFEEKEEKRVPVLYWIHGGGFFSGSISLDVYHGAALAATEGIVVVNVQYRLGPHGFLYFGNDDAPGNMGLLDQALGLKWTRENIEYFGGDPNAVTIAGESCGSASVGFHLVSPISKNYFKRAMMTSGLPTVIYSFKSPEELKSRSYLLAKHAGCDKESCQETIECLRKVDSNKLATLQWKLFKNLLDFPFSPTIDGYFLPDHPETLIAKGKAKRSELIMGTVRDEGTFFIVYHYLNYFENLKPTSVPYDRFVEIMEELFHNYSEKGREAIINMYTNWENPEDGLANQRNIGDAVGDAFFVCPHRKFADNWSNRGLPVYYYHYTDRSKMNPWGEWMGVMHGDDIPLLFGAAVANSSYPEPEKQMSLNFMDMVGNFARKGMPSSSWERYTSEHPVYLDVNSTVITESSTEDLHGPRARYCAFWNKLLPTIINGDEAQCNLNHPTNQNPISHTSSPTRTNEENRPQWNTHGQGIHGGQGFYTNDQHETQTGRCASYHRQQEGWQSFGTPTASPTSMCGFPQNTQKQFGQHSSSTMCEDASKPTPIPTSTPPTSTSCKYAVSEKGQETSTAGHHQQENQQVPSSQPGFVTPPPAVY